jgi:hypothetical protein
MSQAKRDHSAFHQSMLTGRAYARTKLLVAEGRSAPVLAQLQLLECWDNARLPGGDPYNGVGGRVVRGAGLRK